MRAFFAILLVGCGSTPAIVDGGATEAGVDAGPCARQCAPAGWTAIAMGPCAQGSQSLALIAQASAKQEACPCACAQTTSPTCAQQVVILGGGSQCDAPMTWDTSGTCVKASGTLPAYNKIPKISGMGGACAPDTKPDDTALDVSTVTVCLSSPQCEGSICSASKVCAMHDGETACPKATDVRSVLGGEVAVTCACSGSCGVQPSCDGHVHIHENDDCTKDVGFALVADDMCKPNTPAAFGSYRFHVSPIAACTGQPVPGVAATTLTKKQTLCCPP